MKDRTVQANLGGKVYPLVPTLGGMRRINQHFSSLRAAVEAVRNLDFDGVCEVLAAGAGLSPKQTEQLAQEVLDTGVANAVDPALAFLLTLMDPNASIDDDDDEDGAGGSGRGNP